MEWSRLKNIILILLVFTNLCLGVLVVGPKLQSYESQHRTRLDAITFLEEKGVRVLESTVPTDMKLNPQIVLREQEMERSLAAALLGEDVQEIQLGAEVYRYESAAGAIQFHSDGTISAQLEATAFPLSGDPEQVCLSALSKLGIECEILERRENEIIVRQSWENTALFGQTISVRWNETGLVSMDGKRLIGTPEPHHSRSVITVPTALITYLNEVDRMGDVYSEIQAIVPGYISVVSLSGPMELIPVWQMVTDTGIYQLNTVSGELSRMS